MYDPRPLPVRGQCPVCGMELREAVVTPLPQMHGPLVKTLREAYELHVVAVVSPAGEGVERRLLVVCPEGRKPVPGKLALGVRECTAADAASAGGVPPAGADSAAKGPRTGPVRQAR